MWPDYEKNFASIIPSRVLVLCKSSPFVTSLLQNLNFCINLGIQDTKGWWRDWMKCPLLASWIRSGVRRWEFAELQKQFGGGSQSSHSIFSSSTSFKKQKNRNWDFHGRSWSGKYCWRPPLNFFEDLDIGFDECGLGFDYWRRWPRVRPRV